MFEINAMFSRKESSFDTKECVVDKVIRLSGTEYDRFSGNMLMDQSFIKDNIELMRFDALGRHHCLLVVGDGRPDGILVDSSGSDYARYTAFVPNVEPILAMEQYPALAQLNNRLVEIVDYIAGQKGERVEIDLQDLETKFGIDLMTNGVIRNTVLDMLDNRPDIKSLEIDKNELVVYGEPKMPDKTVSRRHDVIPADEKPSVMEQIRAARNAPKQATQAVLDKAKSKGGTSHER